MKYNSLGIHPGAAAGLPCFRLHATRGQVAFFGPRQRFISPGAENPHGAAAPKGIAQSQPASHRCRCSLTCFETHPRCRTNQWCPKLAHPGPAWNSACQARPLSCGCMKFEISVTTTLNQRRTAPHIWCDRQPGYTSHLVCKQCCRKERCMEGKRRTAIRQEKTTTSETNSPNRDDASLMATVP